VDLQFALPKAGIVGISGKIALLGFIRFDRHKSAAYSLIGTLADCFSTWG
jgi:hypothetical protein